MANDLIQTGPVSGKFFIFLRHRRAVNNVAPAIGMPDNGRKQSRTHLFVAATLFAEGGSVPVHIRNMSPSGALIESEVLPEPGVKVVLKRGSLHANGCVVWKVERRAGIAFAATVSVADWMSRHPSPQQARIDDLVSSFKSDRRTDIGFSVEANDVSGAASIEAELMTLRSDLAELEAGLIGDTILVATHPEIQIIDISLQRIDRLIAKLDTSVKF